MEDREWGGAQTSRSMNAETGTSQRWFKGRNYVEKWSVRYRQSGNSKIMVLRYFTAVHSSIQHSSSWITPAHPLTNDTLYLQYASRLSRSPTLDYYEMLLKILIYLNLDFCKSLLCTLELKIFVPHIFEGCSISAF